MSIDLLSVAFATPIVIELAKKAISAFKKASDIKKTQEELRESRQPLINLQNRSPDELIQEVLKLRTYSLQLFDGLDFYRSELDEVLSYLQSLYDTSATPVQGSQDEIVDVLEQLPIKISYDLQKISLIYTVQIQMETIADQRSELENGYVELLRHEYPMKDEFSELYTQSRTILKEKPKLLFEQDTDEGKSARQTVDQALVELRNILSKEREKWEKDDAFVKQVADLAHDIVELYKQIALKKWKLDEDLSTRYLRARDILAQPISVLKTQERKSDLDQVKQVLTDLQIAAYNGQQDDLKRQEEEEAVQKAKKKEEERIKQSEIEEQKQTRRLLILVGIFIVIPVSLLVLGLGVLIWCLGSDSTSINAQIPFLGIPYSILLWSALGSIASMIHLVNVYREQHFQTTWRIFRWAFTRPLIGIIMGIAVYLAVSGGLVITVGEFSPNNYSLLWLLSFVGGFSDRVQQGLINLVVGKMQFLSNRSTKSKKI